LKDYWGMVALLREFPGVKLTFNLVPSLLVQLEAFANGTARDRHLDVGLKPADQLSEEERTFCVQEFFHAHPPSMIDPYPRYRELLDLRMATGNGFSAREQASQFLVDDLRDLQVWHKLAWIDPFWHEQDGRVRALLAKERDFTEDDKSALRAIELDLLRQVIPEYAAAAARGQVELSTSPFYHPILPLLCDTDVYLRTHPHSRMPREPFRHPEDAAEQLTRAVQLHERLFGLRPRGVWPSEGSVSDAMVPLVVQAGFRWMATDEEILARTLGTPLVRSGEGHVEMPERLYRPYRVGPDGAMVACAFRDRTLSDLIGFTYASWSASGAADDFMHRLVTVGRRFAARTQGEEATIFIILDGENAWEYYDRQGRPFLRELYGRLSSHPEITTVTMTEACAAPRESLVSIFPGSWINGDFYVWIGHSDDHRAWSQLAEARRALDAAVGVPGDAVARAREEVLIAEGSDWFWWYGDDHSSAHDLTFDELFRRHVRNVYRALDKAVPEELFVSNITTQPPAVTVDTPTGLIQPTIDGEITSYFEWIGAGGVDGGAAAGAMHQAAPPAVVSSLAFGFDRDHLFVRLDGTGPMRTLLAPDVEVRVKFVKPGGVQVVVQMAPSGVTVRCEERQTDGGWKPRDCSGIEAAAEAILELRVPFRCLDLRPQARFAFLVAVSAGGAEVEHHPRHGPIEVAVPDREFLARSWRA
jgi:alpha-amylase/alpha-mannosidase (GH57 family)